MNYVNSRKLKEVSAFVLNNLYTIAQKSIKKFNELILYTFEKDGNTVLMAFTDLKQERKIVQTGLNL